MGRSYGGRRSRVRIGVRASPINVRAAPHIQIRRPNVWAGRGSNWCKHSLGQYAKVMAVGDRECALMRAHSAQTCAQNHTYSIGGQTAGPIGAHIGTNTYWDIGQKLWGSAIASAHWCVRCARKHAHSTTYLALAPEGLDRLNPKLVHKFIGKMGTIYGGLRARSARRARYALSGRCSRPSRARCTLSTSAAPHIQHRRPNGWTGRAPY
jgi:hypothetical protein